jgi:hypothetical protein
MNLIIVLAFIPLSDLDMATDELVDELLDELMNKIIFLKSLANNITLK